MKRNVSVVCVYRAANCCDTEQRSKYAGFCSVLDNLYVDVIHQFTTMAVVVRSLICR
jgi:hypothetical protein